LTDVRKYDDADWHYDGALEAGQPEEQAFAHIGLYLGWLIRRDLVDSGWFAAEHLAAIKSGQMTGADLENVVDRKLTSDLMTGDAVAFTDWFYDRYLAEVAERVPGAGTYEVADDVESARVVDELLDRRFEEWQHNGRPRPVVRELPKIELPREMTFAIAASGSPEMDGEFRKIFEETIGTAFPAAKLMAMQPPPAPQAAPDLERLFPTGLTDPPVQISSSSATQWRDSLLNRLLKDLGVKPRDATVANAMCGRGEHMLTMQITSIPGVGRASLTECIPRLARQRGGRCEMRRIGDREVDWCSYGEFGIKATWAVDGMIVWVGARDADLVETAIAALP
jgi:hypothetical protein